MKLGADRATFTHVISCVSLLAFAAACRGNEKMNGGTHPPPPPPGTVTCPSASGITVCDLKLEASAMHPMAMDPVVLENVVVTTGTLTISKSMDTVTVAGFFVQDQQTTDTLNGQYSGVLVTYKPDMLAGSVPALYDVVSITGIYNTYGRTGFDPEKQLEATAITNSGTKGTMTPVQIDRSDLIATGGEKSAPYEGVVVKINEATITSNSVMANMMPIYGAFIVDNSLIVSDAMYAYRNPAVNEVFTSIAGVLRLGTSPFESGQYLLTPRFQADVVPKNAAAVVSTIRDIQDPSAPNHPQDGCSNLTGSATVGKCANADLHNVVVTAVGGYVSTHLRGMWIQDDSVADGKYAGVKVVYNPDTIGFVPTQGMRVDVTGQIIEYRSGTQIQYPMITQNGTTMTDLQPVVVTPNDIARTTVAAASPYEGVLVRLEMSTVTTPCVEDDQQRDHGDFILDGVVYVGSTFQFEYNGQIRPSSIMCLDPAGEPTGACNCAAHARPMDQRMQGDVFRTVTGVTDFAYGDFQLYPRGASDLVKN